MRKTLLLEKTISHYTAITYNDKISEEIKNNKFAIKIELRNSNSLGRPIKHNKTEVDRLKKLVITHLTAGRVL